MMRRKRNYGPWRCDYPAPPSFSPLPSFVMKNDDEKWPALAHGRQQKISI
jgi:hypothetical protein